MTPEQQLAKDAFEALLFALIMVPAVVGLLFWRINRW